MADYEFPEDLLAAQRAFWKADARVDEVVAGLPSSQEVLEGAMSDEQREELAAVRAARLNALDVLNRHPWWAEQYDRYAAWKALQAEAKE